MLRTTLDQFFPQKYGGNIASEISCEPSQVCNSNEILFKGYLVTWLAFVALLVPSTYDQIVPRLDGSAEALGADCTGLGNSSCGVRWWPKEWDGWHGMEEQISATNGFVAPLITMQRASPVTAFTGGNSTSNPDAGQNSDSPADQLSPISTGDRAGAGIVTVIFVGVWSAMMWLLIGRI